MTDRHHRNAHKLPIARALVQNLDISVVLCERDLTPGTWIDMLDHTSCLPHPASLIVTSRLADDRLWSEVLNLGGWDVLAKPFDRVEVIRSVGLAWEHWHHQIETAAIPGKLTRATS